MTSPATAITLGLLLCCLVTWTSSQKFPPPFGERGQCPLDVDYPHCDNTLDVRPECGIERVCKGKKKCCFYGCRYRCLLPLQDKPDTCPYFNAAHCFHIHPPPNECRDDKRCSHIKPQPDECHDDNQCQGSERCCCFNCRRQCTPTVKVKPGQCPANTVKCPAPEPWPAKPPVVRIRCENDYNCIRSRKCCESCGKQCRLPVKEHPGFCPVSSEQISCITSLGEPSCSNDANCEKDQKCCLYDDRMQCVMALEEKPGSCPLEIWCTSDQGRDKCKGDEGCPGDKKCCNIGCFMDCIHPIISFSEPVRPGTCPEAGKDICEEPFPSDECKTDSACPEPQKCCNDGCVFKCVDVAVEVRPGTCPEAGKDICEEPFPSEECKTDSACPEPQKCCNDGCVFKCVDVAVEE